ncbi:hypothetical protein MIMGU_mgv1a017401mg [Erythranthe guttata]|uniref:Uncharacterized protein n=1 Tax=Erythranthe guttata TaxID=4155 RepID=A0A022QUK3_ERYGU|nr:hypothetical protein MIMGU_mgv1a017401mg [Erythranthe guttata]
MSIVVLSVLQSVFGSGSGFRFGFGSLPGESGVLSPASASSLLMLFVCCCCCCSIIFLDINLALFPNVGARDWARGVA